MTTFTPPQLLRGDANNRPAAPSLPDPAAPSPASRPFVLASLRALRLDPDSVSRVQPSTKEQLQQAHPLLTGDPATDKEHQGDPVNLYPFIEAERAQQRSSKGACELLAVSRAAY